MTETPETPEHIFVFGSNLAGRHGAGSALHALRHHGAAYGIGAGRQGQAYAIPTKDAGIRTLSLDAIQMFVSIFLQYVGMHPDLQFDVVEIGCGLAGYAPRDIAPFFRGAPPNVILPESFVRILSDESHQIFREDFLTSTDVGEHMPDSVVIYTDGGSRGNPGPAAFGVRVERPDGSVIEEFGARIGTATNNVAEYRGLIAGLEWAASHEVDSVIFRSDSLLLVQQMRSVYQVRNVGLVPLHTKARGLAQRVSRVTYEHIPREKNTAADRLTNLALDDRLPTSGDRTI
jgi:ribonuclease HI